MRLGISMIAIAATAASSACGGGGSSDDVNPTKLWLAPLNGEVDVQLSATEPPTY